MYISEFTVGFIIGVVVGMAAIIGMAFAADKYLKSKDDKENKED